MNTVLQDRIERLPAIKLYSGSHEPPTNGIQACAMELVSWIAGEPWSAHPECACPVIGSFMRSWNDGLPDDERTTLLLPLIPRLVGTRGSKALEERRSLMAGDWLVRVNTPAWLRLVGLTVHADALASLPEIISLKQVPSIKGPIEAARVGAAAAGAAAWDAAWAAAGDAARAAAGAAAWDAAWDAAWAAARGAARAAARAAAWDAAWDAARDAAWDAAGAAAGAAAWDAARAAAGAAAGAAAWDAAWDAARAAAGKKLLPVKAELQQSAIKLIERMIAATSAKASVELAP